MTNKLDVECWDCLHCDGEGETIETFRHICLKGLPLFDKPITVSKQCPGYEWDEVNDKPWYEERE